MKFLSITERLLLTVWVGALLAIGYIAAPTLFAVLDDRQMAGRLAGEMFNIVNWTGLVCGVALFISVFVRYGRQWRLWVLVIMLLLVSSNEFILQPMMQALKTEGITPGTEGASRFGMLHGVSSVLYLITTLCGLIMVAMGFPSNSSKRKIG
jgi:hypothetical protein